ncbi:hypothetical protein C2E25_11825 [Geothermobacter hydrogeniphilus]|uniref:PD-(D/E)XK endonuclease-like domain-containing protein n=1 Tax=Geothermobacter hydrogeniphilus TaxID=1969733 RepID=A0A2K2H8H0_9BACT|nr:PD-(D/E)XK nuclease family protein [Geothermobacter hydrogeniphilus]PNU19520.1 hypothetical protein C2E25_11825 [Geothermobacter hydrogeniphilus]
MTDTPILELAARGPVLTANNRLAATLLSLYDQQQVENGILCWERPAIMPLSAWLTARGDELGLTARLLNDGQVRRLWEEVIEEDVARHNVSGLLQVSSSAESASAARQLLLQYGGNIDCYPMSDDVAAFRRWLRDWEQRSAEAGWLTPAELPRLVATGLAQGRVKAPEILTLAGFDLLPPSLEELLRSLEKAGTRVEVITDDGRPARSVSRCCVTDPQEEVRLCARWTRRLLERNSRTRIGIVAPALGDYLSLLRDLLQAELGPQQALQFGTAHPAGFSLGSCLAEEGPVRLALTLFGCGNRIELAEAGLLLRSPFLGHSVAEGRARALADLELRNNGQSVVPLPRLIRMVEKLGTLPRFLAILKHLRDWVADRRLRRPGLWSEQMARLLEAVGWPGEGTIDSRQYQLVEKFLDLLHRLASLDLVSSPVERHVAVSLLQRMARETEFQVEEVPSRLQVLGLLESSGQSFDALWILGMHDGAFPIPARPNPFLPLAMQKEMAMPHADAGRELEFAQRACQRLFHAADQVVVSWPGSVDGAECRPSPLLADLPEILPECVVSNDPRRLFSGSIVLETWQDSQGPGIPAGIPFKGGTGILKDQALCPFRAFAHHRLLARGLECPDIGLDPMSRGTLVHGLLESFWSRVSSRRQLLTLSDEELARELARSAEDALKAFEKEKRLDLPNRQRRIELQRLQRVARSWLEKEYDRPPFEVIATEQSRLVTIGNLAVRTRIDRIDRLENGRQLVIDYKTGKPDVSQWLDERVSEPQLPIYCFSMPPDDVGGALFARVHCRPDENGFHGLLRADCAWDERSTRTMERLLEEHGREDFDDVLRHWRGTLEQLADEFVDGQARVDPVDAVKACRYCDLLPFCRRLEYDLTVEEVHCD